MHQLKPDRDRLIVIGVPPSDGMDFNSEYAITLIQMIMKITNSEEYCRSHMLLAEYGKVTLRHVTKITPSWVKKYELCAFVSGTNNF
jgi:hypothetical protein